jgi:hypothetical protein
MGMIGRDQTDSEHGSAFYLPQQQDQDNPPTAVTVNHAIPLNYENNFPICTYPDTDQTDLNEFSQAVLILKDLGDGTFEIMEAFIKNDQPITTRNR